jgi:3-oxoacyl-[acyl-carrier-protein] synthase III
MDTMTNSDDVYILASASALPGPPIDNATLARRFGMPPVWEQWVDTFVGTRNRHFAVDLETGERHYSLADLGEMAGSRALAAAGVRPADVDLIVMSTATPDALMPATVNVIADRLGIDGVPSYQIQSGCTGAVQALNIAYRMVRSGGQRTALVLGADSCAKHLDLTMDVSHMPPEEQVNGVLFGDGAGALVLSADPGPGSVMIHDVLMRLEGLNRAPGQVVEWFGFAERGLDRPAAVEDYKAVEESVPKMAVEVLNELLDNLGWQESDIDYLLPPQLSGRMTKRIVESLSVPAAREISCVAEIGNTSNALPFFQLEQAIPCMATGDRAIGISIESSKWIKAGFALEKN